MIAAPTWLTGPAHTALVRSAWWDYHKDDWADHWLQIATAARQRSPEALTQVTHAALSGCLDSVSAGWR